MRSKQRNVEFGPPHCNFSVISHDGRKDYSEATSIKLSVGHQMLSCIKDSRIAECSRQYPPR